MDERKPRIGQIDHVSVLVSDLNAAMGFYRDTLGLAVDPQRPDLGFPGAWLELDGEQRIHLLVLPNPDPVEGRPAHGGRDRHFALTVSDVDAMAERLERSGVDVTRSRSGRRALFCRDPDGNAIEFFERQA